jgi:hypothetical protein
MGEILTIYDQNIHLQGVKTLSLLKWKKISDLDRVTCGYKTICAIQT